MPDCSWRIGIFQTDNECNFYYVNFQTNSIRFNSIKAAKDAQALVLGNVDSFKLWERMTTSASQCGKFLESHMKDRMWYKKKYAHSHRRLWTCLKVLYL